MKTKHHATESINLQTILRSLQISQVTQGKHAARTLTLYHVDMTTVGLPIFISTNSNLQIAWNLFGKLAIRLSTSLIIFNCT